MSTAVEMQMRQAEAQRWLDHAARKVQEQLTDPLLVIAFGREVCARRARKLRKRGDAVRFKTWSVNGKCRYSWMRKWFTLTVPNLNA